MGGKSWSALQGLLGLLGSAMSGARRNSFAPCLLKNTSKKSPIFVIGSVRV
jgi:hypothetical protein